MTDRPIRLRLSRAAGFNLQAVSHAANGREAVNVARPSSFGNPWPASSMGDELAVRLFRGWVCEGSVEGFANRSEMPFLMKRRSEILSRLPELRGKNLACWCKPDALCHADVLLQVANMGEA